MKDVNKYRFFPFNIRDKKYTKIVYKNRCVLVPLEGNKDQLRHLCGYVTFKKTDIPKDWWGNYGAPGLQELNIHGGITYCKQFKVPNQAKIEKEFHDQIDKLYKNVDRSKGYDHESVSNRIKETNKLYKACNDKLSESAEGYVVFGFDCGHYKDSENPNLKDPNHVMILTEQMDTLLRKFKESYEDYRDAAGVTKSVVRNSIIANVNREADIQCELGFGALLNLLSGETED